MNSARRSTSPFNSPIELGLRALIILNEAYPCAYSLQQLIVFDYLLVHSDDIPNGPIGLHPKTPYRSGELMVKRRVLQKGLFLYQGRGLLEQRYSDISIFFAATERSAGFLNVLATEYALDLRERAVWVVATDRSTDETELDQMVRDHLREWGRSSI